MEMPKVIIYPYFRDDGYVYFHLPKRITEECGVTSGTPFPLYVREGKIVIEQAGTGVTAPPKEGG